MYNTEVMSRTKWILTTVIAATLIFVPAALFAQPKSTQTVVQAPVSVPLNATTIFTLVNAERTQIGLKPLIRDARLDASAQAKADDMAQNNYFDHISPTTGKHGYEYIPKGMCKYAGENISRMDDPTGDNNQDAVTGWLNSKLHREAILNPNLTVSGIGANGAYAVQHFCTPN